MDSPNQSINRILSISNGECMDKFTENKVKVLIDRIDKLLDSDITPTSDKEMLIKARLKLVKAMEE